MAGRRWKTSAMTTTLWPAPLTAWHAQARAAAWPIAAQALSAIAFELTRTMLEHADRCVNDDHRRMTILVSNNASF